MNPLVALILAVLLGFVIFGSRRVAVLGLIGGAVFLTQGQSINLVGFNCFPTRCLELTAFLRVFFRKEFCFSTLNKLDRVFFILTAYSLVLYLLRTCVDFTYQAGAAADALLAYFSFRALMRTVEDFEWFLKIFALLLIPFTALVCYETIAQRNLFELIGGMPVGHYFRHARPRAYGSFRHPSLMGSLGSTFLPLYIALLFRGDTRKVALIGIFACLGIVFASNSGGPANTAAASLVGWGLWRMRKNMRAFRWSLSIFLILLALVMKAPIYYLPAKVSSITGGDGYHRAYLIEAALRDLNQWFLAGIDIKQTAAWFPYVLEATGGADMTNAFLSFGVRAGVGAMVCLVIVIVVAFSSLGKALHQVRASLGERSSTEYLLWGLGSMLAAHVVNWFGITYWDQFCVIWYFQLAAISTLAYRILAGHAADLPAVQLESESVPAEARPVPLGQPA